MNHPRRNEAERAQVFLTNALTGWVPARHPQSNFGFPAFTAERDAAEAVKQADTILVILGNPPYNGYPGIARVEEERNLTEHYRQQIPGLPAPQGQGLNELYVRFFRVAERRIAANRSQTGIVSFISGYRWLDGLSHPTMRYQFLQEFDSIYIDNLNGDKYRTGKTTPDGKPDPSAFSTPQNREGIQVGTAISTLVRTFRPRPARAISFRDLWGTSKLAVLDHEAKQGLTPEYEPMQPPPALGLPFADRQHSEAVATWPTLPSLLPVFFPGVKTSRDPLVIDIDRDTLEQRIRRYLDSTISSQSIGSIFPSAMKKTGRFNPEETRTALLADGFKPWQVLRYIYRPFDLRWIYWEPRTKLIRRKKRRLS
jgi:Predicted helicase